MDDNDYIPSDSEVADEDEDELIIPQASYSSDSEDSASAVPTSMYENYDETKSHHENEQSNSDISSYDFFEMCNDASDFYYMVTEFYKANPVPGFRVCEKGECDSIGSVEDEISDGEEESN
jgi:hypothetical protein